MLGGEITACREIHLIDVPEPKLPAGAEGDGLVLFQSSLGCLCGSDLPFYDGEFEGHAIPYPQPPGMSLHEIAGVVVESHAADWPAGTRVVAVPDGQRGLYERFVVSSEQLIAVPEELSNEKALLAQPFGTVLKALSRLPNMIGRDVVVLGQGPIGQMFNAGLRSLGARRIIGIDPISSRLNFSHAMGATDVVCSTGEQAAEEVERILEGGRPDVVIEAVGHLQQAFNAAVRLVRKEGLVLLFGVPPHTSDGVALHEAMWKNVTVTTSIHPSFKTMFPLAMQWIHEGRVDFDVLLTHRFPLAEIHDAFRVFRDREDGAQKVLVDFPCG